MFIQFARKFLSGFIFNRHATAAKLSNLFLVLLNQYLFKQKTVSAYPIKLVFDPSGACNLRCPLCPTGQNRKERSRGSMEIEKYKMIIDETGKYLFGIDLYNWGEPLLNNDIFEMVEYAHQKNIRVTISSNLNILSDEMAGKAVASGLDELIVSIDGASQDTYSRYRTGGSFDRVLANARKIIDRKKNNNSSHPAVTWQFLVFRHNEDEIGKARSMARAIGFDRFIVKYMRSDMGRELYMSDREKVRESAGWLPSNASLSRYDYKKERRRFRPKNCLFLWTQGVINWNGSVSPCCAVYDEKSDFGNAFEEKSFIKVWNNSKFQEAREQIRRGIIAGDTICSHCLTNGFIEY